MVRSVLRWGFVCLIDFCFFFFCFSQIMVVMQLWVCDLVAILVVGVVVLGGGDSGSGCCGYSGGLMGFVSNEVFFFFFNGGW